MKKISRLRVFVIWLVAVVLSVFGCGKSSKHDKWITSTTNHTSSSGDSFTSGENGESGESGESNNINEINESGEITNSDGVKEKSGKIQDKGVINIPNRGGVKNYNVKFYICPNKMRKIDIKGWDGLSGGTQKRLPTEMEVPSVKNTESCLKFISSNNIDAKLIGWKKIASPGEGSQRQNLGEKISINQNLEYQAVWAQTYEVTFWTYKDQSNLLQSQLTQASFIGSQFKVEAGRSITLPNPPSGIKNNQVEFNSSDPSSSGADALFTSWSDEAGNFLNKVSGTRIIITEDLKFYGNWHQTFWVKFFTHKDTNLRAEISEALKTIPSGYEINFSQAPTMANKRNTDVGFPNSKNGFDAVFKGWAEDDLGYHWDTYGIGGSGSSGGHKVTRDLNFYGKWNETYEVKFYSYKENSNLMELLRGPTYYQNIPIEKNTTISFVIAPSRRNDEVNLGIDNGGNAIFKMWMEENNSSIAWNQGSLNINKDLKLYGIWNRNHKVKFLPYRSSSADIREIFVEDGEKISDPSIKVSNKQAGFFTEIFHGSIYSNQDAHFLGWYFRGNDLASDFEWDFSTKTVGDDINLYARSYPKVVISNGNGNIWITNPLPPTNRDAFIPGTVNPDFKAYFAGWYQDLDSNSSLYQFDNPQSITLYGKWSKTVRQPKSVQDLKNLLIPPPGLLGFSGIELIDTSEMTSMDSLFIHYSNFKDSRIQGWDVSGVRNMREMFRSTSFNKSLGGWNVGKVTNMYRMFSHNTFFDQDMSKWPWKPACNVNTGDMFSGGQLSQGRNSTKRPLFYEKDEATRKEDEVCIEQSNNP